MQESAPETMTSRELVSELFSTGSLLAKRQVKLARLEIVAQLAKERTVAKLLAVGGAIFYAGVIVLLVAAAAALGLALGSLWCGALVIGGALVVVAGVLAAIGWSRRVREPLPLLRKELEKEMSWAKRQHTT